MRLREKGKDEEKERKQQNRYGTMRKRKYRNSFENEA